MTTKTSGNGGSMDKVTAAQIDAVEFDLDALTANEFNDLAQAERALDLRASAAILARVVTKCPWGEASEADTYGNLPVRLYLRLSRRLAQVVLEEVKLEKET